MWVLARRVAGVWTHASWRILMERVRHRDAAITSAP
jgi:hypothetical protein